MGFQSVKSVVTNSFPGFCALASPRLCVEFPGQSLGLVIKEKRSKLNPVKVIKSKKISLTGCSEKEEVLDALVMFGRRSGLSKPGRCCLTALFRIIRDYSGEAGSLATRSSRSPVGGARATPSAKDVPGGTPDPARDKHALSRIRTCSE
jgi:hypothetical protein